ncbi:MAG: [FeFe] hydrogenase H-cluster radical SAM maturase HydE, partial [Elusimicrobiota bacterium]|nr:[FeFe] hydrogenase H-cluster radical SAM maturase HydE [Elusimicrobiota bacterium]
MTEKEIVSLLNLPGGALFKAADEARQKAVGDGVHLRALIEFSNHCAANCLYCGIRRQNPEVKRYRMSA